MKNYLKKFSIMFVMLLAVIGVGMIQNGAVANAATVGTRLENAETGWQRIDGSDNKIIKEGNWALYQNDKCFNKTNNAIEQNNTGSFTFYFYGTEFRILQTKTSDLSKHNKIYIDGTLVDDISLYNSTEIRTCLSFEKTGLDKKVHTVKMEGLQTNTWCMDIDAIDIDDNGYLLPYNESITLDKSTMNLNVNDSQQLTATTTPAGVEVTWKSSDTSIVTVESTGKVTGVKEGQATITATTTDGLTATCAVTVTPKGTELNPNPTPNPVPTDSDNIVNIAHAKGDNTNNAGGGVTIIFNGVADTTLSVVKTADVKSVYVGDTFTYTIVVTNTGSKIAKAVVINDSAPNHIDFMAGAITTTQGKVDPSSTSKNIIVNVGDIPPSGIVTIKIPVTVIL